MNARSASHPTYTNSFKHISAWQKSAKASSRASGLPACWYDAICCFEKAQRIGRFAVGRRAAQGHLVARATAASSEFAASARCAPAIAWRIARTCSIVQQIQRLRRDGGRAAAADAAERVGAVEHRQHRNQLAALDRQSKCCGGGCPNRACCGRTSSDRADCRRRATNRGSLRLRAAASAAARKCDRRDRAFASASFKAELCM